VLLVEHLGHTANRPVLQRAYTPATEDHGDYPLTLEVRDESNAVIARATSTVHVASGSMGFGLNRSLLLVGDSWTSASEYPEDILNLGLSYGTPRITLIGSRGPGGAAGPSGVRHEGYSGWSALSFTTPREHDSTNRVPDSPFIFTDGAHGLPALNFQRYLDRVNRGDAPDFVVFALGINDVFNATDEAIDQTITKMFAAYDDLIEMVRRVNRNIRIGLILIPPPSASQDGFRGYTGTQRQTRWQFRRNQHRLVERMIETYGNHERDMLYLIPAYLNLDTVHGYPQHEERWNTRTIEVGSRVTNGTYPSVEGYKQYADSIYCWLRSFNGE
jgi:hypothetical protein